MSEFKKGDRVSCDVVWHGGRRTNTVGEFLCEANGEAYVETAAGIVAAPIESVEKA